MHQQALTRRSVPVDGMLWGDGARETQRDQARANDSGAATAAVDTSFINIGESAGTNTLFAG